MGTNVHEMQPDPVTNPSVVHRRGTPRRILAIVVLVTVVAVAGIFVFAALTKDEPKATTSPAANPAGIWYYLDADSFTVSTIGLDSSGSLLADIYWGDESRTVTHNGTWVFEDGTVLLTLDNGITENWDLGRDGHGNEILTYRDSSAPDKTVSMPGTIAYRSQELMEKNK